MEHSILNIRLKDKRINTVIRKKTQVIEALQHVQALKSRSGAFGALQMDSQNNRLGRPKRKEKKRETNSTLARRD